MIRAAVVMGCLWALSVAHAAPPVGSEQARPAQEPSESPYDVYPVDPHGGPRGPRSARRTVGAQLTTTTPLPAWTFQRGTSGSESARGVATCDGFVYTVGTTGGTLPGQPQANAGGMDVFITKQKASNGALVWVEQFGGSADDMATGIAVTGCANGNASIYVTGYTKGNLPGGILHTGANQGGFDVFVRKYDGSKALKWSRQRGSNKDDQSYSIAVNETSGDVYVTGHTLGSFAGVAASGADVFIARYRADGSVPPSPAVSAIQFGSSSLKTDYARSITVDRNGKVYVAGYTNGVFPTQPTVGGNDAFVVKYPADLGNREWVRQVGTSSADYAYGVAASKNASGDIEIYVVGQTFGALTEGGSLGGGALSNAGDYDALIFQFSDSGVKKRAMLKGTMGRDSVDAITSDGGANLYIVGSTSHNMSSNPGEFVGSTDVFLLKYDVTLSLTSAHQYGSDHENPDSQDETPTGVAADRDNGVFLTGFTEGNIGTAVNEGGHDFFVMRYSDGCSVDPALLASCGPGGGSGDPHLRTMDRYKYDFQGVGEFILTESIPQAAQPFSVQVRQVARGTRVSVYSAVAARFGTARVGYYARSTNPLMVNGAAVNLPIGDVLPLADGTRVLRPTIARYIIASSQGDRLVVDHASSHLDLSLILAPSRAGQVRGLLGNFNNVRADEFALRNGTQLTEPLTFSQLYTGTQSFAQSWRITQTESLFDYGQGESTTTFTNASLPSAPVSTSSLTPQQRQAAQQTCQAAGVTDPSMLDDCILDVGVTEDATFATSAAQAQAQLPIAKQAYLVSFEEEPGPEWSNAMTTTTPMGDRSFLGEFGNEAVQLSLPTLPAHSSVTVTFDLLVLQGWDGNGPFGPNFWGMQVDGLGEVVRTTFSNTSSPQFYPSIMVGGMSYAAGTGAAEINTLFYPDGDALYRMSITFDHTSPSLGLVFFAEGLPGITNETWGIDNLEIKVK